ncbi:hypothetical protein N7478_001773 [Penicillium angulare]|uniref:uncharacterized protein n=1 Tax=Penicillium angulare TaxID=116970 RepID=UPI002540EF86|nr:uncharacterized protein N7478_001773 [Penicillium angulare]KAJ5288743.1 hypothetical protein N7478_001773 [Penicillium angulare]
MESSTTPSSSDDITWHIYVGTISTIVPATLAVILRLTARHVSRAGLWWDDHTIVIALILNWAMVALKWAQILLDYYGPDSYYLPPEKVQGFGKVFLALQLIYFLNAVFTKASLLLLYYRIFGVVQGFRWTLWISGFIVIAYWLANTLVTIFQCWPIAKLWNPDYEGHCINIGAFGRWSGVANVIIYILILCLPYPMAWRLQTTLRQKIILTGIFLLGALLPSVVIVSILRVTSFDYENLGYGTYKNIEPATWSSIEQSVGIICACLPTLRPFFRWLYGASRKSTRNRGSGMSEFPKQTPLACRTSQAEADEENILGLADLPARDEREAWQEVRRSQVGVENDRPSSQGTVGSHISQDFQAGKIGISEPRPSSFA